MTGNEILLAFVLMLCVGFGWLGWRLVNTGKKYDEVEAKRTYVLAGYRWVNDYGDWEYGGFPHKQRTSYPVYVWGARKGQQ